MVLPGDKSISHRALLLSALAEGRSNLQGLSTGRDVQATADALRGLGVDITLDDEGDARGLRAEVDGGGLDGLRLPTAPLDCGNSGTTMRLLTGLLAGQRFGTRLVGDASLSRRPMARIVGPLRARGAHVGGTSRGEGGDAEELYPPINIAPLVEGESLGGLQYEMPLASAQVKSAMLLSGLYATGPTMLREPVLSRDHTERMLLSLGVPVETVGPMVVLDPDRWSERRWPGVRWTVPGDLSSAAFLLAAAGTVPDSLIRLRGVGLNPTRTGLLEVTRRMGLRLATLPQGDAAGGEPTADLRVGSAPGGALRGTTTGGELLVRMIDEVPAFCALAARARGRSEVRDAADLRHKESDRLGALKAMLEAFRVECDDLGDGLGIEGVGPDGRIPGAEVDSRGDHRIAMAAAVLALGADEPTIVRDVACIETSFPGFVDVLRSLGADVDVVDERVPGEPASGAPSGDTGSMP